MRIHFTVASQSITLPNFKFVNRLCCGSVTFWYGSVPLNNGSGCGSGRLKNTRIRSGLLVHLHHSPSVLRIRDVYPGSRILIFTHPGSRIPDLGSRILDPKTATKERGEKKLVVIPFYVDTNFKKL
jgi:hypothetical protein